MPAPSLTRASLLALACSLLAGTARAEIQPLKARIVTSAGTIEAKLYADKMPRTVSNFVKLARDGFYDGQALSRYAPPYAVQAGDPIGDGSGGPGYCIRDERVDSLKHDKPNLLTMASTDADAAGSQFFVTLQAASHLDGRQSPFGEVTSGAEVLAKLAEERAAGKLSAQKIEKVEITGTFTPVDYKRAPELSRGELESRLKKPVEDLLASIGKSLGLGTLEKSELKSARSKCARSQASYEASFTKAKDARLLVYSQAADQGVSIEQFQFGRGALP